MKFFPAMHQLELNKKNPSYLNSLFVGVVTPFLNFPSLFFRLMVFPLVLGFFKLLSTIIIIPYHGLMGNVITNDLTVDQALEELDRIEKELDELLK